ncbi:MAG: hypothetical protein IJ329_01755 [Clostridia bacterium]|nr:hypothetical protein [Clostridia bacterium]
MKKLTIASLLALSAACAFAAIGCGEDETPNGNNNSPAQGETRTITLEAGEGYSIVGDDVTYDESNDCWVATAVKDSTYSFSLDVGAFYTGTPTVTVNNVILAEANGEYSVTVSDNMEVSIDGIFKDVSSMVGTGAFDDAYVVSRPIDLVYIAEQVNAGKGNYASAAYVLAADIDCKSEEIGVIGTDTNPFTGCFTCLTNSETGEMERYSISNFKINASDKNYVGLFGCVQVDMSVTSSGLFYGIRIDNFEINASTSNLQTGNKNIYCGGLIGYGLGTRAYLCDATNGEINISADSTEFSFVGGMMGVQQSVYMAEYNQFYTAETAYATVDVDVTVVSGTTLYAGGIAGYLYTNSFATPSFIHNSYSTGNVSGAIRTGGIVGGLGQYSSVATCYSSGNVTADVKLTANTDGYLPEHCIAYAGGIVGFAENDTVVNDCFAVGNLTAKAVDGASAEKTHYAIGGGDEDGTISVAARKYVVRDCIGSLDKATMQTTLSNMGWQSYNWNLSDSDYPTINYESSDESVTVKTVVKYIDKDGKAIKVGNAESEEYSYTDMYVPIATAFVDGFLSLYLTAEDNALSFGYYFDEACTQPVPYSYVTTKNTVLYMGFTDPANVVGEYTLAVKGAEKPLTIQINADGTVVCADGKSTTTSHYQYDGEALIIENARLARYFTGEVDTEQSVNEDTLFDMNRYANYYFQANKTENGLEIFDGTYFTATAPLRAYTATEFKKLGAYYVENGADVDEYVFLPDGTATKNGKTVTYTYADGKITVAGAEIGVEDLKAYNNVKGTWQKSAFVNKVFYFDGIDGWRAYTNVYTRDIMNGSTSSERANLVSGTYETTDDVTYILKDNAGNEYARVTFDEYGYLQVTYVNATTETYYGENSFVGEWMSNGITLRFNGIKASGVGEASVTFESLNYTYDLTYMQSESSAYLCLYYEDVLFGYFTHDILTNYMYVTLYDPTSIDGSYVLSAFRLVNNFDNVWISNNETFDDISFNGVGSFDTNGNFVSTLTLNGERIEYTLTNGGLNGYFDYNGTRYTIAYDDIKDEITVNTDIKLERKDALSGIDFVSIDANNNVSSFAFNGKSNLTIGGEMTATLAGQSPVTYGYIKTGENAYTIINGDKQEVGSIVRNDAKACYEITLNGVTYTTYIRNEFIGNWALSGTFTDNAFVIGATDLDGYIHATFQGEKIKIEKLETDFYYFSCEIDDMPVTYYMYVLYNTTGEFDSFALSEYTSLVYGEYILCSRVDPMQGTWTQNTDANFTISFDGVQSSYSNGTATLSYKQYATPYLYRIYTDENGNVESVMLWSQNTYDGKTLYYKLTPTATTTEGTFVLGDKAYVRSEIDSLYKMEAKDTDGYTYTFDGGNLDNDTWGTITATKDGEETRTLTYDIVSFNDDKTATITVKETVDGEEITYTATLDYSDATNLTITFVKQAE